MCFCGACERRGAVAREERRGPAVPHQEEPRGPDPQTHADIQGEGSMNILLLLIVQVSLLCLTEENFLHI